MRQKNKYLKSWLALFVLLLGINTQAQVPGCTDPLAVNFNSAATQNDGSCTYNGASVNPTSTFYLDSSLQESSGLVNWNNSIWTHNDNSDINLYSLDTLDGSILQTFSMTGVVNTDWEEISQDSNYFYIGDFGNNVNGNRTDLRILRIEKNSVLINNPVIDTINFSYADQTNFNPTGPNNTDFDCEAFVVSNDSIYLFTKQWVTNRSNLYSIPKDPGTYIATLLANLDVQGMITGATYLESKRLISMCGYTGTLQPFIYLLYDFNGTNFFNANKRKLTISLPFHQVEGISTTNGLKYYVSNEAFIQSPFNIPQKLLVFNLNTYLSGYLSSLILNVPQTLLKNNIFIYPNPASDHLVIESNTFPVKYTITNSNGQTVMAGKLIEQITSIGLNELSAGNYFLIIEDEKDSSFTLIKR